MKEHSRDMAILVVNYNGLSSLGNLFIESIESFAREAQECGCADVWLIDNNSRDGSVNTVRKALGDRIGYVLLSRNLGYGGACNAAYYARLSGLSYRYIACANNDIILARGSLRSLINYLNVFEKVFTKGFIAAPLLVNGYTNELDYGGYYIDLTGRSWPLNIVVRSPQKLLRVLDKLPLPVIYADGAFIVFHSSILKALGTLFDHRFFLYSEDVDAGLRAWSNGIPSFLVPVVLGRHFRSTTASRIKFVQLYVKTRNSVYTATRYYGIRGILYTIAWRFFFPIRYLARKSAQMHQGNKRVQSLNASKFSKDFLIAAKSITRGIIDGIAWGISERRPKAKGSAPFLPIRLTELANNNQLLQRMQERIQSLILRIARIRYNA